MAEDELMLELSIGGIFKKSDGIVDLNVKSEGENQVIRRRKRGEKAKNSVDSGSCGPVSGTNDDETARKKEKVGEMPEKGDVNCVFRPKVCRSFRPYGGCYCKINSNRCGSLAYSDGQCSSHQGGVTDESRSNSSNSQLYQQPASTSTASVDPFDPSDHPTGSSKQTVPNTKLTPDSTVSGLKNDRSKPKTSSQSQQASLLARMPCVSTTGNGPNGKTVSGFLYRYTKNEVNIVCVCHGRSFSPAGFVEHAGGVDIVNPLKHITIFPAAFAS